MTTLIFIVISFTNTLDYIFSFNLHIMNSNVGINVIFPYEETQPQRGKVTSQSQAAREQRIKTRFQKQPQVSWLTI